MQGAGINHCRKDSINLQAWINSIAHCFNGFDQQCDTAKGEKFRFHRNNHTVCRGQGINGEQAKRRLAVNQNDVVVIDDWSKNTRERGFTRDLVNQLNFGSRKIDIRGHDIEAGNRGVAQGLMNIFLRIHQKVIDCVFHLQGIDAQANGCSALRIKVNNENTTSIFSKRCCKIDGCRCFPNSTFLITHRNNACGSMPGQWCRDGEIIFFVGRKIPGKRWLRWIRHVPHLSALLHTIPPTLA